MNFSIDYDQGVLSSINVHEPGEISVNDLKKEGFSVRFGPDLIVFVDRKQANKLYTALGNALWPVIPPPDARFTCLDMAELPNSVADQLEPKPENPFKFQCAHCIDEESCKYKEHYNKHRCTTFARKSDRPETPPVESAICQSCHLVDRCTQESPSSKPEDFNWCCYRSKPTETPPVDVAEDTGRAWREGQPENPPVAVAEATARETDGRADQ